MHAIGNATVAKFDNNGCFPLFNIGDVQAEMKHVEAQPIKLPIAAYCNVGESITFVAE